MASPSSPTPGASPDPPNSEAHPQSDIAAIMPPSAPKHHRSPSSDSVMHDKKRAKPDDEPDTDQEEPSTNKQLLVEAIETKTIAVRFPSTIADPEAFVKAFKSLPGELRNRIYDFVAEGMFCTVEENDSAATSQKSQHLPLGPAIMANLCGERKPRIRMKWRVHFLERFNRCFLRSLSHDVRNEFLGRFWKFVGLRFCSCKTRRSDGLQVTWKQTTKLGYDFNHSFLRNIVYNVHYRGLRHSGVDRLKEFCQMLVKISFKGNLIVAGWRFDVDFATRIIELFGTSWYEGITIEGYNQSTVSGEFDAAVRTYQEKCDSYGRKLIHKLVKQDGLITPGDADQVRLLKKIDFRAEAFNGKHYDSISYADLWNTEDEEDQMAIENPWELWDDLEDGHTVGDGGILDDGGTLNSDGATFDNDGGIHDDGGTHDDGPDGRDGPDGLNEDGDE